MAMTTTARGAIALLAIIPLAACDKPLDFDLRENFGDAFSTADAARGVTAARPDPDDRGIISYPNYQVAVARNGDTVQDVADRIGMSSAELARYNGLNADDRLRKNEVLALPKRVAEPSPETGADTTGPIQPPSNVDIAALAGRAIDSAEPAPVETQTLAPVAKPDAPKGQTGIEPVRHKVSRGETAYTISRLYGVSVRALSEWNGLDANFTIREGQFLLIPVPDAEAAQAAARRKAEASTRTSTPGQGSVTPTPPSAKDPLPTDQAAAAAEPAKTPEAPKLGQSAAPKSRMGAPVEGSIIRAYSKGKNDGIDISAPAGTKIKAAADGVVAAITSDADKVPIVVIRHPKDLLTVYANVDGIVVKKGDTVKRGQAIAKIRSGSSNYVHFEVRKKFDSVDPSDYLP